VPALDALRHYSGRDARADVVGGLSVAAVAVPQAMAYAMIAGLPAVYGLYTAIVMTAVGALFDSSRQLINGPTNAISIALLGAIGSIKDPQLAVQHILLRDVAHAALELRVCRVEIATAIHNAAGRRRA